MRVPFAFTSPPFPGVDDGFQLVGADTMGKLVGFESSATINFILSCRFEFVVEGKMLGSLDEEDGQYSHGAEQKPVLAFPFRLGEYSIPVM